MGNRVPKPLKGVKVFARDWIIPRLNYLSELPDNEMISRGMNSVAVGTKYRGAPLLL